MRAALIAATIVMLLVWSARAQDTQPTGLPVPTVAPYLPLILKATNTPNQHGDRHGNGHDRAHGHAATPAAQL